jgi:hypothetical protein
MRRFINDGRRLNVMTFLFYITVHFRHGPDLYDCFA